MFYLAICLVQLCSRSLESFIKCLHHLVKSSQSLPCDLYIIHISYIMVPLHMFVYFLQSELVVEFL